MRTFTFGGTLPGCFTIVNRATTPCSECCSAVEICFDTPGKKDNKTVLTEVDCNLLNDLSIWTKPDGLKCTTDKFGNSIISWKPVIGAVGYYFEIYPGDPE